MEKLEHEKIWWDESVTNAKVRLACPDGNICDEYHRGECRHYEFCSLYNSRRENKN